MTTDDVLLRLQRDMQEIAQEQSLMKDWQNRVAVERAAEAERMKSINKEMHRMNKTLDGMASDSKWQLRVVAALVIGAAVKWVLDGGLAGLQ